MKNVINRYEDTWQECQFWNQTLEEELENLDVQELRTLLNESDAEELGL